MAKAGLYKAQLFEYVVCDKVGEIPFLIDTISGATGTMEVGEISFTERHYDQNGQTVIRPSITLDCFLAIHGMSPPDLIKIDVEGAEQLVFNGASTLIGKHEPIFICECFSGWRAELVSMLEDIKYRIYDADRISDYSDLTTNFLCLPNRYRILSYRLINDWREEYINWFSTRS